MRWAMCLCMPLLKRLFLFCFELIIMALHDKVINERFTNVNQLFRAIIKTKLISCVCLWHVRNEVNSFYEASNLILSFEPFIFSLYTWSNLLFMAVEK